MRYLTIIILLLVFSGRSFGEEEQNIFSDDYYMIVDISYERQIVGEGLEVYTQDERMFLPLVDLVGLLELNIKVNEYNAIGELGDNKLFSLNKTEVSNSWQVNIGELKIPVASESIYVYDNIIYIEKQLADEWFGSELRLDFSESKVFLLLHKDVPLKARIERENRKAPSQNYLEDAKLPVLVQPYRWIEVPSIDVNVGYSATRYEDEKIKDSHYSYYAARTVGDFLGMSASSFFSGDRVDGLKWATIKMDRFDNDRNLLGPLKLSQISVGDIGSAKVADAPVKNGRGILIGNDVVTGGRSRDEREIEGDFYPGWEVELYLNTNLVGYQKIDDSGHYIFTNIILFEGVNRFVLKFFGPNGQIEEQSREIVLGDDPKNRVPVRFSLSITEPNKRMIDLQESNEEADIEDNYQIALATRFRLSNAINLTAGALELRRPSKGKFGDDEVNNQPPDLSNTPSGANESLASDQDSESLRYYSLGLQTYLGGVNIGLNGSKEQDGNAVYSVNMGTVLAGANIYFGGVKYEQGNSSNMDNNNSISKNPLLYSYNLAMNKSFSSRFGFLMQLQERDFLETYDNNFYTSLSGGFGNYSVSTTLSYDQIEFFSENDLIEKNTQLYGSTFLDSSFQSIALRFSAMYTIKPDSDLTNLNFSAAFRIDDKTNLDASINHILIDDMTIYRIGVSWVGETFRLSPSIQYNDTGRWQGTVQLATSLGKRTGRVGDYYKVGSDATLSRGAIKARLFEDVNADGKYQEGETLLSGGEVSAVQLRRKSRSNMAGNVWVESLTPWQRSDIRVDENTINEGYMALAKDEFSLVPRPGRVTEVDLPFVRVGEIDGTVEMTDGEFTLPAAGVVIQLIDASGAVADERRTDSSGYFDFPRIIPGRYSFSVKDGTLIASKPSIVEVLNSGNYESGIQITIKMPEYKTEDTGAIKINIPASSSTINPPSKLPIDNTDTDSETKIFDKNTSTLIDRFSTSRTIAAPAAIVPEADTDNSKIAMSETMVSTTAYLLPNQQTDVNTVKNTVKQIKNTMPTSQASRPSIEWRLQAGSFSNKLIAERFFAQAKTKGFTGIIQPAVVNGVDYFRVYLGEFKSRTEALLQKNTVDASLNIKSIAVKPVVIEGNNTIGQL